MANRSLSATQLSQMLGYKSKTPLLRVLQGKAGLRSVANVFEILCLCEELDLTDAEKDDLKEACQVEYWGLDRYRAQKEMHRLLLRDDTVQPELMLSTANGNTLSFSEFLELFVSPNRPSSPPCIVTTQIDIILYGGCYLSVMQSLANLLNRLGDIVHIRHLFRLTADTARTIRTIRHLIPMVGYPHYEAYKSYETSAHGDMAYSTSHPGHALLLRAVEPDGTVREFQLLLQNKTSGVVLEAPGVWETWRLYGLSTWEHAEPLIAPLPCVKDYVSFVTYFAVSEKNREILAFKSDLCLNFIPSDILYHALTDAAASLSTSCEEVEEVLRNQDKLLSLQEKRFQNICIKKQPTYWVASAPAMRQFARTGIQKDHFFAMRPFTVEERLRIFRVLVKLCQENDTFHFHFLKDGNENQYLNMEVLFYTDIGFQLTPVDVHYNLNRGWSETMFTEPTFCSLYREFYLRDFIPNHTRSAADSVAILEDIIAILETGDLELL